MSDATVFTKRDATAAEARIALEVHAGAWNGNNPLHRLSMDYWEEKEAVAIAEGYKAEVCSCGVTFCAFHHYTTCRAKGCPFSDGVSLLERMAEHE